MPRRRRPRRPASLADEAPPETTTIRLAKIPASAFAPRYLAEELLRAEGFTDVRYVPTPPARPSRNGRQRRARLQPALRGIARHLDAGEPITALAGVHSGCYELFAHEPIRSISDLKGKKVGIQALGRSGTCHLAIMAALRRARSRKDIDRSSPSGKAMELFAEGKSMPSSAFRPSRRSCAPARSAA